MKPPSSPHPPTTEHPQGPLVPEVAPSTRRPFTVVVEGNIGSGKSTFLDHFSKWTSEVGGLVRMFHA